MTDPTNVSTHHTHFTITNDNKQVGGSAKVAGMDELLSYTMDSLCFEAQEGLRGISANFPIRPVGMLMGGVCFPTGAAYAPPSDRTGHKVSNLITTPTPVRDLLMQGIFVDRENPNDQLNKLCSTLPLAMETDAIQSKAKKEKRALTAEEKVKVDAVNKVVDEIIQVDSFDLLGNEEHLGKDYVRPALRGTRFATQTQTVNVKKQ